MIVPHCNVETVDSCRPRHSYHFNCIRGISNCIHVHLYGGRNDRNLLPKRLIKQILYGNNLC